MNKQPIVTDEEVNSLMNFDSVVASLELAKIKNRNRKITAVSVAALLGILGLLYTFMYDDNQVESEKTSAVNTYQIEPKAVDVEPSIIDSVTIINDKEHLDTSKPEPISTEKIESVPKIVDEVPASEERTTTTSPAYEEAEPVNGYPHLYAYFQNELQYPTAALKDSIQGIVTVNFVINRQGLPEKIQTDRALGDEFDQESIRLIKNMPAWKPAQLNGQPVPARISLPLTFQIIKFNK